MDLKNSIEAAKVPILAITIVDIALVLVGGVPLGAQGVVANYLISLALAGFSVGIGRGIITAVGTAYVLLYLGLLAWAGFRTAKDPQAQLLDGLKAGAVMGIVTELLYFIIFAVLIAMRIFTTPQMLDLGIPPMDLFIRFFWINIGYLPAGLLAGLAAGAVMGPVGARLAVWLNQTRKRAA